MFISAHVRCWFLFRSSATTVAIERGDAAHKSQAWYLVSHTSVPPRGSNTPCPLKSSLRQWWLFSIGWNPFVTVLQPLLSPVHLKLRKYILVMNLATLLEGWVRNSYSESTTEQQHPATLERSSKPYIPLLYVWGVACSYSTNPDENPLKRSANRLCMFEGN